VDVHRFVLGLAATSGLLCALARWGWQSVLVWAIVVAVLSTVAVAVLATEQVRLRRIAECGLWSGFTMIGAAGLVAVLGWIGVLVVLALAATSPALRASVSRARGSGRTTAASAAVEPTYVEPDPEPLDDAALCAAWRRSYFRLREARTTAQRLSIVQQRQRYLDELQRRHAQAVERWLEAGPRASGNPLPYIQEELRRRGAEGPLGDQ
jgi:hypothetical protein